MSQRVWKRKRFSLRETAKQTLGAVISGLVLAVGMNIAPATAAERINIGVSSVGVSVSIADLETFLQTGQLPPALQPYRFVLTQEVRQALSNTANLNPSVSDDLIYDLLDSTNGDRLLNLLQRLIVGSTREDITTAITQAAQQPEGLSLIEILRQYPQDQIRVDLEAAIALLFQMNQSRSAVGTALDQGLSLFTLPFRHSLDPAAPGTAEVRQRTLTFRDWQRDRTISADLYWSSRRHGSLVVLSHGFAADRRFLGYLGEHLASHGFTVAAIEHPGSSLSWFDRLTSGRWVPDEQRAILPASEFVDRPRDIQFLLNELEQLERQSSRFSNLFNTEQVTVIGHSLGGYTALALAGAELDLNQLRTFCNRSDQVGLIPADWLQCTAADLPDNLPILQDERIAQIIALNPVVGDLFTSESLAQIQVPTIVLSNSADTLTPPIRHQLLPFEQMQTEKYLITAIGATHLSAGTPGTLNQALVESAFVRERPSDETEPLRQVLKGLSLAFVQQLTPEAINYRPFLTPAYVQFRSTHDLKLRLATDLSPRFVAELQQLEGTQRAIVSSPRISTILATVLVKLEMSQRRDKWLLLLAWASVSPAAQRKTKAKDEQSERSKVVS
ncbi:alpha/beta hydrolase [Leptolyngbya ohadii]|uniref:alpha/beta hydrolase n=1 Tax=Leptolyngbya ohadii TaxID=1962290 RepID=UPI000B59E35B|nr:alpha/beta hydrolase [Leptolyngbya ohadii]